MVTNRYVCQASIATSASIYASGDQIGVPTEIDAFSDGVGAEIQSLVLLDKDQEKAAIDVFFFNNLPLVTSADNDAFALASAAELDKCVGVIPLVTGDYVDAGTGLAVATKRLVDMVVQNKNIVDALKKKKLWFVLVSRGTPDYDEKALVLKLGMEQG